MDDTSFSYYYLYFFILDYFNLTIFSSVLDHHIFLYDN